MANLQGDGAQRGGGGTVLGGAGVGMKGGPVARALQKAIFGVETDLAAQMRTGGVEGSQGPILEPEHDDGNRAQGGGTGLARQQLPRRPQGEGCGSIRWVQRGRQEVAINRPSDHTSTQGYRALGATLQKASTWGAVVIFAHDWWFGQYREGVNEKSVHEGSERAWGNIMQGGVGKDGVALD